MNRINNERARRDAISYLKLKEEYDRRMREDAIRRVVSAENEARRLWDNFISSLKI